MYADKITIGTCSHKRYFVVRPAAREVLCHGNANAATLGLYYHAAAFDFAPQMVVQYDTRKEAEFHRHELTNEEAHIFVDRAIAAGYVYDADVPEDLIREWIGLHKNESEVK